MAGLMKLINFEEDALHNAYRAGARDYRQSNHACPYNDTELVRAWNAGYSDAKNQDIKQQLREENERLTRTNG
jgi:ribosome modulation factor